jgi:Co/Zn/Cd efflux system component
MRAFAGIPPDLDMTWLLYIILGVAAGLKVILYLYCVALQKQSESMLALAEDHRNDIMSNVVAILTGAAASYWREGWWIDPVGGILISLYIIYSWGAICKEQVNCIAAVHQNLLQLAISLHHQLYVWHAVLCKSIYAQNHLYTACCNFIKCTHGALTSVLHGACTDYLIM